MEGSDLQPEWTIRKRSIKEGREKGRREKKVIKEGNEGRASRKEGRASRKEGRKGGRKKGYQGRKERRKGITEGRASTKEGTISRKDGRMEGRKGIKKREATRAEGHQRRK